MTFDLWILMAATLLGLVHLSLASFLYKAQEGNAYTAGPRDDERPRTGAAGRLDRAQRNFLETFPLFAACVLVVHVSGTAGSLSFWGGVLYLAGRIAYLPLYAFGVPWLRTFSWNIATLGLVFVGLQVFAL